MVTAEQLRQLHGGEKPATPKPAPQFTTGADPRNPATPAQRRTLKDMLAERNGIPAAEAVRTLLNEAARDGALNTQVASQAISTLRAISRNAPREAAPVEAPAVVVQPVRVNKYGGKCESCTKHVGPEEGRLSKADDGTWQVWHLDGECPETEFPFPYGRYAIEVEGEVKFYAALEDGLFAQASDDLHPVKSADTRKAVIEAIAADPLEASKRWGREFETCGRCGRGLTSDWRKVGVGPVCAQKGWD